MSEQTTDNQSGIDELQSYYISIPGTEWEMMQADNADLRQQLAAAQQEAAAARRKGCMAAARHLRTQAGEYGDIGFCVVCRERMLDIADFIENVLPRECGQ